MTPEQNFKFRMLVSNLLNSRATGESDAHQLAHEDHLRNYVDEMLAEKDDLLNALKVDSQRVSLPEHRTVDVMQQSDSTWWMAIEDCYALVDLDRGGFVGLQYGTETTSGNFHWGTLEELDVFLTLLLVSRKTYIEKGVQRYRAETGL